MLEVVKYYFFRSDNVKSMKCGYDKSTATHTNSVLKSSVVLAWTTTLDNAGKTVEFSYTVVQDYSTFWAKKQATNTITLLSSTEG